MRTCVQSTESEKDLNDIFDYIALQGISAAEKLIRNIYEKFALLCEQPEIGRKRDELLPDLRSLNAESYLIFYRERNKIIEIARVLHGSRDFTAIFTPNQKPSPMRTHSSFLKREKE